MQIETTDAVPERLEVLARASAQGTFYHTPAWIGALDAAIPHLHFRCLVARDASGLRGAFPYFLKERGRFRSAWSMPLGTYGGPITDGDPHLLEELLARFHAEVDAAGVQEVGWVDFHDVGRFPGREAEVTHEVDLSGGWDHVWSQLYEPRRRQHTRRASREGLVVDPTRDPWDLARFHEIYVARMHRWGSTPILPRRFFRELLERGGDQVRFFVARRGDTVLGGHFNFYHRDTVILWFGVCDLRARSMQPDSLLYSTCLRDACERGYRRYNLGASLGRESLMDFKKSLGGVAHHYTIHRRRTTLARAVQAVRRLARAARG